MGEPMTPTPTPQEVLAYFDAYAEGRMTPERARLRIEFALSAYQQEVERLTKERDEALLPAEGRCSAGHRPSLQYDLTECGGEKGCVACDRDAAEARVRELEQIVADRDKALALRNAEVNTWMRDAFDAQDRVTALMAEVERLTKERDDWKLATDQFHGMWSDAEARAADAKRAAFAEAAQYIRDLSVAAGRDTPDMQALADLIERLAAQAVPPGFCASCTPDIRPQCESASWCMRPRAVPPGATEDTP
jgi:hypothetical protein